MICAGMAGSKWLAKLASAPCDPIALMMGIPGLEPVDRPKEWLKEVPIHVLAPIAPQDRERLETLGYRFAGQLQGAGDQLLRRQFPASWLSIRMTAEGTLPEPARPMHPRSSRKVVQMFSDPIANRLDLGSALEESALKLAMALCTDRSTCESIRIILHDSSGAWRSASRKLIKPVSTAAPLLAGFRALLSGLEMTGPVERMEARAEDLKPAPVFQKTLMGGSAKEERAHSIRATLGAVRASFGDESICLGRQLPAERRVQVLRAWRNATGWM